MTADIWKEVIWASAAVIIVSVPTLAMLFYKVLNVDGTFALSRSKAKFQADEIERKLLQHRK